MAAIPSDSPASLSLIIVALFCWMGGAFVVVEIGSRRAKANSLWPQHYYCCMRDSKTVKSMTFELKNRFYCWLVMCQRAS